MVARDRPSSYRQPASAPAAVERSYGALPLVVGGVLLTALIAAIAAFAFDLPAAYAVACGAVPVGLIAVLQWNTNRAAEDATRALWSRIARRSCPACATELGLPSLYAGAALGKRIIVTHVGSLTIARCTYCGARSAWTNAADPCDVGGLD